VDWSSVMKLTGSEAFSQVRQVPLASTAARVFTGAAALALSSHLAVPFWPVPMTGQTLAVLLLGVLLGPRQAVYSVLAFMAAGLCGLPVFSGGAGPLYMLGPTGGYMLGFIPAACLAGTLARRGWGRSTTTAVAAMVLADAALFACGLAWLAKFLPGGQLFIGGLVIFLPGECVKIAIAAATLRQNHRP
jgi:biotin transport system substrate-specific component